MSLLHERGRLVQGLILGGILGAVAMSLTALYGDASALAKIGSDYPWRLFGGACALALGNYAIRFARWELYLRALGIRIPTRDSLLIFVAGFSMSITPAKMGELLKSWLLKRQYGIAVAKSAPVVVVERIADVTALLFLIAIGAHLFAGAMILVPLSLLGILLILALSQRSVGIACLKLVGGVTWLQGPASRAEPLMRAYWKLGSLRVVGLGFVLSLSGWALEALAFLLICDGLPLDYPHACFIFSASTLGGALSMLPGGLGPTEVGFTAFLQGLGATAQAASFCTILTRLATLWLAVGLGLIALVAVLRRAAPRASTPDRVAQKAESAAAEVTPPTH